METEQKSSDEERANIFSRLFLCWVLPFFKIGCDNESPSKYVENDTGKQYLSSILTDQLEKNWRDENTKARIKNVRPKLRIAIMKTFGKSYAFFGFLMLLQNILIKAMLPIVLAEYLKYFQGADLSDTTGWCLGAAIVLLAFVNIFVDHHCQAGTSRIGLRIRTACSSLVYRKILKLSRPSSDKIVPSRVVSLLSNDKMNIVAPLQPHLYTMPIQILASTFVLYDCVGLAGLAGVLLMLLQSVPLQCCLFKIQSIFLSRIILIAEKRVGLTREIINGIQTIKMNAWEQPFQKMVRDIRKLELDQMSKLAYVKAITDSLSALSEYAAILVTLAVHILLGNQIESSVVFSAIVVFSMLQYSCYCFQEALVSHKESHQVMEELEGILALEETGDQTRVISYTKNRKVGSLRTTDAHAGWGSEAILKDINIKLGCGKLCCIVGHPGSGKTSFLLMLLKEMPLESGKVDIVGNVSYAPKEPWIFAASVRENILFGRPYNRFRYRTVIKACGLDRDIAQFPEGEKTVLLDEAMLLNEAQRTRIGLARAVYADADVYLFDECLSKMDSELAQYIGTECVQKYLGNKTRVLVTNQLRLIRGANLVVVMEKGRISKATKNRDWTESDLNELKTKFSLVDEDAESSQHDSERRRSSVSSTYSFLEKRYFVSNEEGIVDYKSCKVLSDYFKAGASICPLICLAVLFIISQVVITLSYLWITYWVDANSTRYHIEENRPLMYTAFIPNILYLSNTNQGQNINQTIRGKHPQHSHTLFGIEENYFFVYVLAAIVLTSFILLISRSFVFRTICLVSTKILHCSMFENVLMGSMNFFLTNPPDEILDRFSKDLIISEYELPQATINIVHLHLVQIGMIAMIFLASPLTIAPAALVTIVTVILIKYFSRAIHTILKLESKSLTPLILIVGREPMISHISSTIRGVSIIRSSEAEKFMTEEYNAMQDKHNSFWLIMLMMKEAFGFYLDITIVVFLAAVTFHFNLLKNENTLSGCVGLAISQSLALVGLLQLDIRRTVDLSVKSAAVARILQYTALPKEIPDEQVRYTPTNWPCFGKVIFRNATLRCSSDEAAILDNFNLVALPGQKVGIIGKPGSGKSSVIAALFRLAPTEGLITIDDVDTSVASLRTLRSNITLVSHDPLLFSPTIKFNLDPFGDLSDDVLWKTLEEVELTGVIGTLSHPVHERGTNFNLSMRQQIGLAQAILRRNKIVILDATKSNTDEHIDLLTSKALQTTWRDSTVLVVTDRPHLVVACDKVAVLEAGQAVECDHAHALLRRGGRLAKMAADAGVETVLGRVAEEDYGKRHLGIEFTFDRFE